MIKQAPAPSRIVLMALFALSCFGVVFYLWVTFGGPVPLKAQGYRVTADFKEATLTSQNATVRVSGVDVGKIVKVDERPGVTRLTLEIEARYAPIPRDSRAVLRRKTALGEAYVELSPGNPQSGDLVDGGHIPRKQVQTTVELDELIREFDEPTREAMKRFVTGLSLGLDGRAEDINDALGHLEPLSVSGERVLGSLHRQRRAVRRLVSDTGTVFRALGQRQGELSGIVRAGNRLLSTTASRNRELAETVRILPVTLRELRPTFREIEEFSGEARPVVQALRPAGRSLGGALVDARALSPDLRGLFADLDKVIDISPRAVPAATRTVRAARPLFGSLAFALRDLLPVVDYLGLYKQEITTQLANQAGALNATEVTRGGIRRHYLRTLIPFTAEGLVVNEKRMSSTRPNPYFAPRALDKLATGLESFNCAHTGNPGVSQPAPPCKVQSPLRFRGKATSFPRLMRDSR